ALRRVQSAWERVAGSERDSRLRLQLFDKEGDDGCSCRSRVAGGRPQSDDFTTSTVSKLIIELARSTLRVEPVGRAFVVVKRCPFACSSRARCQERGATALVVLVVVLRSQRH